MTVNLWIVGDSFSQPVEAHDPEWVWPRQVADMLSQRLGKTVTVTNESFHGVSQDFNWFSLQNWTHHNQIGPNDYLIVVLTHPNRYWFFEDMPDLANPHWMLDVDEHLTPEQLKTVELYIKNVQRPSLDSIQLISRLGWLSHAVTQWNLRRPLVIKGFDQQLCGCDTYRNLNVAQGCLWDVQRHEFEDLEMDSTQFFRGIDARYHHMTRPNHDWLSHRVVEGLINNTTVDLTAGYTQELLSTKTFNDHEFCQNNLNMERVAESQKRIPIKAVSPLTAWLKPLIKPVKI